MNLVKKLVSYVWAFPVTFFGLLYVGVTLLLGWHRFHKVEGNALVFFSQPDKMPKRLRDLWQGANGGFKLGGHSCGQVIVLNGEYARPEFKEYYDIVLAHELIHTSQVLRLGIFQPITYAIIVLTTKVGCDHAHPYYDNHFETDARRGAGQWVDYKLFVKRD